MAILPRARVRVRPRCDDDCECPDAGPWAHPLAVALVTVAAQVVGEIIVRRWTAEEPEQPAPKGRGK